MAVGGRVAGQPFRAVIMSSVANTPRLGEWLLEEGYLNPTQLDLALREQKRVGKLLGEALVDLGFVGPEVLARFLARKTQTETMDLRQVEVAPEVLRLVPEDLARRWMAVPVACDGSQLTVAIADPLNVTAFDRLEHATGHRVHLVAASEGEIREMIERLYHSGQSIEEIVDELLRLDSRQLAGTTEKDAPTIRLADRILHEAVNRGASDIHLHPEERILRVRFRRDGVLDSGNLIPKALQPALLARFKILGGMDVAETRRTQDGRGSVSVGGREVGLRFSLLPTAFGESLVVRLLDRGASRRDLGSLGFDPELARRFRELLELPHGVILVTGPTGSGKTTTLYTALCLLDGAENSIFTLEDPVEYHLPLIRQTQVHEAIGLTFADGLRTLLRQDPDVILVGETRDTETAQLMIRAALTGHLVFSTLHTNDAVGAIPRLLDLGVPSYLLAPTLGGVLAQRLVRRLCPECSQTDPEPGRWRELVEGIMPGADLARLQRPRGCAACRHGGYAGRLGLHELLVVDGPLRTAITAGADTAQLEILARKSGFRSMFEDGVAKSLAGQTTLEEVLRATRQ